jgi:hypothetical protein
LILNEARLLDEKQNQLFERNQNHLKVLDLKAKEASGLIAKGTER